MLKCCRSFVEVFRWRLLVLFYFCHHFSKIFQFLHKSTINYKNSKNRVENSLETIWLLPKIYYQALFYRKKAWKSVNLLCLDNNNINWTENKKSENERLFPKNRFFFVENHYYKPLSQRNIIIVFYQCIFPYHIMCISQKKKFIILVSYFFDKSWTYIYLYLQKKENLNSVIFLYFLHFI